jgi:hypothetical protein
MSHKISRRIPLSVLVALLLPAAALAEDRLSPRHEAWWRELARCGGLALAVRDRAVEQKASPERIAGLTRDMNAYLDAGAVQLRHDRSIEPSPAKRSVYQAAGKAWEDFKKSAAPMAELDAKLADCTARLAEHGRSE